MPKYILCLTEKSKLNILCLLYATDCPVFKVKAKINVLVPSDVINRSKSIDFTTKRFQLLVFSEARTRSNDITKQISRQVLGFLGYMCNYCIFHCAGER